MAIKQDEAPHEYRLSERRFRGSREEVLQQLDELLESLLGFRQSLVRDTQVPSPSRLPRRSSAWSAR